MSAVQVERSGRASTILRFQVWGDEHADTQPSPAELLSRAAQLVAEKEEAGLTFLDISYQSGAHCSSDFDVVIVYFEDTSVADVNGGC